MRTRIIAIGLLVLIVWLACIFVIANQKIVKENNYAATPTSMQAKDTTAIDTAMVDTASRVEGQEVDNSPDIQSSPVELPQITKKSEPPPPPTLLGFLKRELGSEEQE